MQQFEQWCNGCNRLQTYRHNRGDQDGSHKIFKCTFCGRKEPVRFDLVGDFIAKKKNEVEALKKKLANKTAP